MMQVGAALSAFLYCALVTNVGLGQDSPAQQWPLIEPITDPALTRIVSETLESHPQVAAALAALEASDALERAAARPMFNPEFELAVDSSANDQRTLGVSQTLDWSGQRSARTTVADRERLMTLAELALARSDMTSEFLAALADYWVASGLDELARMRLDLMQSFADLALQRQRAGDLTQVDLSVARLGLAQAGIEQANTAGTLVESEQTLRTLGPASDGEAWPLLPTELPAVTLDQLDVDRALAALPVIRAQRAAVTAAEARIGLRESERRPSPTIALQGGQEEGDSLIGLSFTMPLYVRNRFTHEVAAARAEQRQAKSESRNMERRALGRLLAVTERYRLTRDAWSGWVRAGAPNLTEQTVLLERLWEAGELSLTDYLVQLNQTFDTAASALELNRQLWVAWFEWLRATAQLGAWLDVPVE